MSEKPEGPGWWIASDGNWYPPELHPSVREEPKPPVPTKMHVPAQPSLATAASVPQRWQSQAEPGTHVGPQFPDLFQKALQGSHLVDNVTVMHSLDDSSPSMTFTSSLAGSGSPAGSPAGGAGPKRRWRKGR